MRTLDTLRAAVRTLGGPRKGLQHLANLGQALTRVGSQEVSRLALSSSLSTYAQTPGPLAALKRSVWIDGVASAVPCQTLAKHRGLRAEEAFVLGLLRNFGRVVVTNVVVGLIQSKGPRPASHGRVVGPG